MKLNCRGKTDRTGARYRYYCCPKHDPLLAGGEDRRCTERNIRAEALDDFVLARVKETLLRPDVLLAGGAALAQTEPTPDADTGDQTDGELEDLRDEVTARKAEEDRPRS